MIDTTEAEINLEELRGRIKEAVARREAEGKTSFINASAKLLQLLSVDDLQMESPTPDNFSLEYFPLDEQSSDTQVAREEHFRVSRFVLQPEFTAPADDRYHVNDLLKYHDAAFVWNAYRALLKREPDEPGFREYLAELRSGRRNKIDIIASLRFSEEGRSKNVSVEGLRFPALLRRAYRLPALGYLLELCVALARLPLLFRSQREMESYFVAQHERVVGHLNVAHQQMADQINSLRRRIEDELARAHQEMREHLSHVNRNMEGHIAQVNQAQLRLADSFNLSVKELSLALNELSRRQRELAHAQHNQLAALFREQQEMLKAKSPEAVVSGLTGSVGPTPSTAGDGERRARANGETPRELDELYAALEDKFRGTALEVKDNLRFYLPFLKEAGARAGILDLGCGRGEWLELLREEGYGGRGVESNGVMVERARERGLEVIESDALSHLRALPDESLRVITGFHLIEHLEFNELVELVDEALRTLVPGGLLIFETPNPKNLVVGACNFYSDPTHRHPLFPETVQFILTRRGFARVRLEYLHPVGESPFLERGGSSSSSSAADAALDSWFFSPRDFAVLAWKP